MKYAIIKTGGKQLKASVGEAIWIEKINIDVNKPIEFKEILAINDGKKLSYGTPLLKATVIGTVQKQGKGPKLIIFRTKAKSNWSRKQGHRQPYTRVMIDKITLDGKVVDQKAVVKKATTVKKPVDNTNKKTSESDKTSSTTKQKADAVEKK